MFNPLDHPVCLSYPLLIEESAWCQHVPFAMFLVSATRPSVVVELGTWKGVSYCAFCQAVKELQLQTKCYAVDTWKGDKHAGFLSEDALFKLKQHHDPLYSSFSTLLQSTFDEAVSHFNEGEIDLLHIDGLHTYESVKHDFETWLPKISLRGVVLFHDTNERKGDFGVHRFWKEVSCRFPSFEFLHGHGLGMVAVGKQIPDALKEFFDADEKKMHLIRHFFQTLGSRLEALKRQQELERYIKELKTYEETVKSSRLMRGYRSIKVEGFRKSIIKIVKRIRKTH